MKVVLIKPVEKKKDNDNKIKIKTKPIKIYDIHQVYYDFQKSNYFIKLYIIYYII